MKRKIQKGIIGLTIVFLSLSMTSCLSALFSSVEKPKVTFDRVEVKNASIAPQPWIDLKFYYNIDNPHPVGVTFPRTRYTFYIENHELTTGSTQANAVIKASGRSPFSFVQRFYLKDLPAIARVLLSQKTIAYKMDITFYFDISGYGTVSVPVTHRGSFDNPIRSTAPMRLM